MTGNVAEHIQGTGGIITTMQKIQLETKKIVRDHLQIAMSVLRKVAYGPKSTSSRSSAYRPSALVYYTGEQSPQFIVCMVSGVRLPAAEVTAGHIFQQRWPLSVSVGLGWGPIWDQDCPQVCLISNT